MIICPECRNPLDGFDSVRCAQCGWEKQVLEDVHVYLAEQDRSDSLLQSYAANYESLACVNVKKSNLDQRYLRNQAKNLADQVPHLPRSQICDLGCGQGMLTRELIARGCKDITIVDISPTYLGRLSSYDEVTAVLANAERLPFKRHFDVVFCSDVMEHVLNVGSFLICLNKALKFGGLAVIRVPYRESLLLYSPFTQYSYEFGHLRSFNTDLVKVYMRSAGFEVTKFRRDGFGLGMPRPFIRNNQRFMSMFVKVRDFLNENLIDPTIVTRLPAAIAGTVLRTNELVFVAQKVKEITLTARRGYELTVEESGL